MSNKTRRIISIVIVVILAIAMVASLAVVGFSK